MTDAAAPLVPALPTSAAGAFGPLRRIRAMLRRHYYILKSSPVRIVELLYWPAIQMILWGFMSKFFAMRGIGAADYAGNISALDYALATLLGAVMLWDFLFRTQLGVSLSFLEEVWARNLGHLFVSPLRPHEWWGSMMLVSLIRALLGAVPAALLAVPFYGFSLFDLGLPLLFFFLNLTIMGWWLGFMVTALLMRAGPGAEGLAWALTFMLAPFCAVYYPVDVLPEGLQVFALALPAAHVFEGLRDLAQNGIFDAVHGFRALGLNLMYMTLAVWLLQRSFNHARQQGTLLQSGE